VDLTRAAVSGINRNKIDETPVFKQRAAQIGVKSWQMNTGRQGYGKDNVEDIRWLIG
jgi:hypothetical protein